MLSAFAFAAVLAAAPTVEVPVPDPLLPQGPLWAAGAGPDGEYFVEAGSYEPTDIPGLVGVTAVIVTAEEGAPLHVARAWIDCKRRVYQLSSGRRYDAAGKEIGPAAWVPDRAIEAGTAPERLAAAFCPTIVDTSALDVVGDYREALAR